jgi:4-hydroxy-tetrahydrodipicolinate synthase
VVGLNRKYCGCWTALVTPFNVDYSVNWDQLERNVMFQLGQGVSGVLPMGTTGESPTVTHQEQSQIIENTVHYVNGKTKVLAGTGSNSTDEAMFETKKAIEAGVDACLLVDCYYNKPSSLELRNEYYAPILAQFPKTDFISYVIPGRAVTALAPEDLCILRSKFKNLVAVKEATGDLERMRRTRDMLDADFNILCGDDSATYSTMTDPKIASSGVISVMSNIMPAAIEKYTRLVLKGDLKAAKRMDDAMMPLFQVVGVNTNEEVTLPNGRKSTLLYKFPNPVPVKTLMVGLGMMEGPCKRPLGRLTKQGVKIVREALRQVWKNDPSLLEPIEKFYDVDVESRLGDDKIWEKLSY